MTTLVKRNPPMAKVPSIGQSEGFTAHQNIACNRALELDFQFLKDINQSKECAEFHG